VQPLYLVVSLLLVAGLLTVFLLGLALGFSRGTHAARPDVVAAARVSVSASVTGPSSITIPFDTAPPRFDLGVARPPGCHPGAQVAACK